MISGFFDFETEDLFNGVESRRARQRCPAILWPVVRRKLTQVNRARDLEELAVPPRNRMEGRQGGCRGQESIRVSDRFRVCFRWEGGRAEDVEVVDVHRER